MVRNYKLFLFAQLIALLVVAPVLAMEQDGKQAPKREIKQAVVPQRIRDRNARRFANGFAAAIGREDTPAQENRGAAAGQAGCAGTRDLEDLSSNGASQGSCGSCHACPSHQSDDQADRERSLTPQQIKAINDYRDMIALCESLNEFEEKVRNCCKKVSCTIS
jgi:hypothetical protein